MREAAGAGGRGRLHVSDSITSDRHRLSGEPASARARPRRDAHGCGGGPRCGELEKGEGAGPARREADQAAAAGFIMGLIWAVAATAEAVGDRAPLIDHHGSGFRRGRMAEVASLPPREDGRKRRAHERQKPEG